MTRITDMNKGLTGGLTRRDMLRGTTAAGIMLPFAGSLILPAGMARAQEPQRGGRIRVATNDASPADMMDPARQDTFTDGLRSYFIYEKLTEIDHTGAIIPQLAESWSSNAAGDVWTFELRKNVTFHDGKPFTAADVIYSYKRILDPATASTGRDYITDIATMKNEGDHRLVIELSGANSEFPTRVAMRYLAIIFDGAADFPKDAIGTGPWKLADFQAGIVANFTRNENYWRPGLPYIDEIESFGIGDEAARLNALLSGEADVIQGVNAKAVSRLNASGVAQALISKGGAMATFSMRADTDPYTNVDIRKALKHSFDRQKFLDLAFDGVGMIGSDHPVPPGDPMYAEGFPVPAADPDLVKSLLAKAGASETVFELHTSDANYGGANAGIVLGELMNAGGAKVKVTRHPADGYWTAVYMKVPFSASSWTVRPTAITRIESGWVSGAAYNEGFWSDPRVDQNVRLARQELDDVKRKALLADAQEIIANEGSSIIPIFVPWIDGVSTRVQNMKAHPLLFTGAGQWAEVWLNA